MASGENPLISVHILQVVKALGPWKKVRKGNNRVFFSTQECSGKCFPTVKTFTSFFCTSAVKDAYSDLIGAFLCVSCLSGFETVTDKDPEGSSTASGRAEGSGSFFSPFTV